MNLPDELVSYLAARDVARQEAVEELLKKLTERERRILREAAVMGYVRGVQAGSAGVTAIPKDTAIQNEVIDAILAFPDLYPILNSL